MTDKELPDWVLYAKRDREIIEASMNYWKEDVAIAPYTDEEKIIFVLMDCLARAKAAYESEIKQIVDKMPMP